MTFEKLIQCAKCKKNLRNEIIMNCISVQVIDSNIVQEIKRKQQSEEVRKCGSVDFVIDDDKSDIPLYEPKCDGDEITQDNIINIPSILTIVASEHVGCDYMFLDLPENIRFMNLKWELSGVILKNECHFRGIIKKTDTIWSLYDGMKTGLIQIDAGRLSMNEIITLQGEDYGIITVFYCQSKNSVTYRQNVARMNKNIEHPGTKEISSTSVLYPIDDQMENENPHNKITIPTDDCNLLQSKNDYNNQKTNVTIYN